MQPLPNLTIQQLQYLVAVADSPTWATAASELGVTPSALSQGLAELERRIDFPLFQRDGRRRVLAPLGSEVLAYAHGVLTQTRDLERWLNDARSGRVSPLRVGMIDAAALGHWRELLQSFRSDQPETTLHLSVAPSGELLEQLNRNQIDLAVIVAPPEIPPGLDWTELRTDPLAIYAPPGTPIGHPSEWGPWVSFPTTSHTRHLIEAELVRLGVRFDVVSESHQPEVLREMVRLGMGWTVLPVIQAETTPNPLVPAQAKPVVTRKLIAAHRQGALPHPMLDAFVASLGESSSGP